MIGVSLPMDFLLSENGEEKCALFSFLKSEGVGSIEMRTVRAKSLPEDVLRVMMLLWDEGFSLTVHGEVKSRETCIEDVFYPLSLCLQSLRQEKLNITIHPIEGDNVSVLVSLSDHAEKKGYPVTFSLENNRLLPGKIQGDSTALVLDAVKRADRKNVGICFDMGHFAYYVKKNLPEDPTFLPPDEFWKYVTHTHIHALNDLRTHFPLEGFELPIREYFESLSWGYFGVYNLELDFPRLREKFDMREALERSLPRLRESLLPTARLYDRIREEFDTSFERALSVKEKREGTHVSLVHAASYLFSTKGYFWGMDLAFRWAYDLSETPHRAAELLKDLKLMVITHGHRDHFEERLIRALSENDTLWLIPDFLEEKALSFGIRREKMILAHPGEEVTIGPLTLLPFVSRHFRPVTGKGVKEYGYYVTCEGEPSLAFPGDIRDFSDPVFPFEDADVCFGHVWYGDDNRKKEQIEKQVAPFANFMLSASRKKILLCHLYENGRPDHLMWRIEHAEEARKEILAQSPKTRVLIPDWGEVISL